MQLSYYFARINEEKESSETQTRLIPVICKYYQLNIKGCLEDHRWNHRILNNIVK